MPARASRLLHSRNLPTVDDALHVQHGHDFEHVRGSRLFGRDRVAAKVFDNAVDHPRRAGLAGMHAGRQIHDGSILRGRYYLSYYRSCTTRVSRRCRTTILFDGACVTKKKTKNGSVTLIFRSSVSAEVIVTIGTSLLFNVRHMGSARNKVVVGSTEFFQLKHLY